MQDRQEPGLRKVAEILQRMVSLQEGHRSYAASSAAGERVSSSSGSAPSTPQESGSAEEADYVRAVLDCYLSLPGTSSATSRHDRRCAQQLHRRGVPLEVVKSAMVVAVARRTFRRGGPLPRVRAVHYFLPVVEELLESPCDPGYVRYLEQRLRALAAAQAEQSKGRPSNPSW